MPPPVPGSNNDTKHHRRSGRSSVGRLGQRETVGVVAESQWLSDESLQILMQRFAVEPDRVGVLHQAGRRGNGAGDANANRAGLPELTQEGCCQVRNDAKGCIVVAARCRYSAAQTHVSLIIQGEGLNLGAADVEADFHVTGS